MPTDGTRTFRFKAVIIYTVGQQQHIIIEATDRLEAIRYCKSQGFLMISIEADEGDSSPTQPLRLESSASGSDKPRVTPVTIPQPVHLKPAKTPLWPWIGLVIIVVLSYRIAPGIAVLVGITSILSYHLFKANEQGDLTARANLARLKALLQLTDY